MVRTSVTQSAIASFATFLFLPHFDVICDLLLNRRTATWNLFVKLMKILEIINSYLILCQINALEFVFAVQADREKQTHQCI